MPKITDKQELLAARLAAAVAIIVAGYSGINPPGFVAEVVAFAFAWRRRVSSQPLFLVFSTRK